MSINGTEEKLFQYADDTNPIIPDDNSLNKLFKDQPKGKRLKSECGKDKRTLGREMEEQGRQTF